VLVKRFWERIKDICGGLFGASGFGRSRAAVVSCET
jgi:hypothetical protein